MGVKFRRSPPPRQISPTSVQRLGYRTPKTEIFLLRFDQNVESKRPAGAYPLRDFWATVCKTVRPMLSDRCLSCLSVCDVGVFWPNGWTDQDETWHAGIDLGPGHIVLDGDPAPSPKGGRSPPPIFGPYLLQPNGWMDQDATCYGDRPQSRRLCVRWGPRCTLSKNGAGPPLRNFRPISIVVKRLQYRCMHQDATWYCGK